jgi:hypothetical protein
MTNSNEIAKATQEVAKVADKALDQTAALGRFLHKVFGGGLEHFGGAFNDWAAAFRQRNALRIADKMETIHAKRKLEGKTIPVPPRLAIPLLQQATVEDNDMLQDMWAALLANATDPERHISARRAFVHLLAAMEPNDAKVLLAIHSDELNQPTRHPRVLTAETAMASIGPDGKANNNRNVGWVAEMIGLSKPDTMFSVENLARLGLVEDILPEGSTSAIPVPASHSAADLGLTFMGRELLAACQTD